MDSTKTPAVGRKLKRGRAVQVDHVRITVLGMDGKEVQLLIEGAKLVEMVPAEGKSLEPPRRHRLD